MPHHCATGSQGRLLNVVVPPVRLVSWFGVPTAREMLRGLREEYHASILTSMGLLRGEAGPTRFFHLQRNIAAVVHGDDGVALVTDEQLKAYAAGP